MICAGRESVGGDEVLRGAPGVLEILKLIVRAASMACVENRVEIASYDSGIGWPGLPY